MENTCMLGSVLMDLNKMKWATANRAMYSGPECPGADNPVQIELWNEEDYKEMHEDNGFYVFTSKKSSLKLYLGLAATTFAFLFFTLFNVIPPAVKIWLWYPLIYIPLAYVSDSLLKFDAINHLN